jgi:hypothetical protein
MVDMLGMSVCPPKERIRYQYSKFPMFKATRFRSWQTYLTDNCRCEQKRGRTPRFCVAIFLIIASRVEDCFDPLRG